MGVYFGCDPDASQVTDGHMLGRESPQRSFLDASWSAEALLGEGDFYATLYREGPKLYPDDFFSECYTLDNGRPSVPPSRMMKLVLLQHWEGLSDRRALERMTFDLRWKAVLGMEVGEKAVAQSTLVEFRSRLQLHEKMEQAFGRFLDRAVERGLIDADEAQVVDSTAVWGRGAVEDTYNLIGSAAAKVLRTTAAHRDVELEAIVEQAGLNYTAPRGEGSLKGRAGIDWSEKSERQAFLNRLVEEARGLLVETRADQAASAEVREAAELLARILCQDLEPVEPVPVEEEDPGPDDPDLGLLDEGPETDSEAEAPEESEESEKSEPGHPVLVRGQEVRIRQGVATDRIVSVHDPEMRHGRKSHQRKWNGYKAHISVTTESQFVTAVDITPANVGDADAAPALLDEQRRRGLKPTALVGDMAYSAAELRQSARDRGTEICARVPPTPAPGGRFSKDEFILDLETGTATKATCPAGETTTRTQRRGDGGVFLFDGDVCAGCTLRDRCTSKAPDRMRATGIGRTVGIHPHEELLQEARAQESTETFTDLIAKRPDVERKIAHLMGRGLRQARYFGTLKTRFQAQATALVDNLARFGTLLTLPAPDSAPVPAAA